MNLEDPTILPAPHRLIADGNTTIHGSGRVRLVVRGGDDGAQIVLHAGRDVPYSWSGTAGARAPAPDQRIWVFAEGVLEVSGISFSIDVSHGHVEADLSGCLDVAVAGRGHLVSADGSRRDVGRGSRGVRIDGPRAGSSASERDGLAA